MLRTALCSSWCLRCPICAVDVLRAPSTVLRENAAACCYCQQGRHSSGITTLRLSCPQAERFTDALIIAALQGPGSDLWLRTRKAYMARVPRPYMPVVTAISDGDFAGALPCMELR